MLVDFKIAVRQLARTPGFTITIVATLALGIGACTAVFSVVNGVLLRSLPYEQPGRLVSLWEDPSGNGTGWNIVAAGQFADWRDQITTLEAVSAIRRADLNLTGEARPERLNVHYVSAPYLRILRVRPLRGRDFLPDEDRPGKGGVAILSHRLWQEYFGGAPDLVGRTIRLGGESCTVVGILPAEPRLRYDCDVLMPFVLGTEAWHQKRDDHRLRVIGRMKPEVTLAQVQAEMDAITARLRPSYPSWKRQWGANVAPMHAEVTSAIRPQLWVLSGAVAFVLLIACGNVAGLLLARMAARQKEMAIRAALGAGRWQLVRQLLSESLLLSSLGGALGVLLSLWGVDLLKVLAAGSLPSMQQVGVDVSVLGFALAVSLATGVLSGLGPLLHLARLDPIRVLGRPGAWFHVASAGRLRGVLIVAEVALALTLLTGAGLLLTTLFRLQTVAAGFDAHGVLAMDVSLDEVKYPVGARRTAHVDQIIRRVASLPGVEAVGATTSLPMGGFSDTSIRAENLPERDESYVYTDRSLVSGDFFAALRIPLLKGRLFTAGDEAPDAPGTVILSAALAREVYPGTDPVGQIVRLHGRPLTVIGVVGDVHQRGLDRAMKKQAYLPHASEWGGFTLVVRSKVPPSAVAEGCRTEILRIDPNQPLSNVRTLDQIVADTTAQRRLMFLLLGGFAAAAVALTAVGLHGLLAYSVSQRTREIGIRMALGARPHAILRGVLEQGLRLAVTGVLLGLAGAFSLTRVLAHLLFGVTPRDPVTLVAGALVMVAATLAACWLPARRATRVNPVDALRAE